MRIGQKLGKTSSFNSEKKWSRKKGQRQIKGKPGEVEHWNFTGCLGKKKKRSIGKWKEGAPFDGNCSHRANFQRKGIGN